MYIYVQCQCRIISHNWKIIPKDKSVVIFVGKQIVPFHCVHMLHIMDQSQVDKLTQVELFSEKGERTKKLIPFYELNGTHSQWQSIP